MIVALIDNGSLEPAAHVHLRATAAALSEKTGVNVHAVSWKHSDRIVPGDAVLPQETSTPERGAHAFGAAAWTLDPFVRAMSAFGQREFLFVPFFISAQGAIGSALRTDLEKLQRALAFGHDGAAFEFAFTDGLAAAGAIPSIVSERVRATLGSASSSFDTPPPVIVLDHGGPSAASAALRDEIAGEVRRELGFEIGPLAAASMEGSFGPLLADQLRAEGFAQRKVIVAPMFLSPGRHAGPGGDIARICAASSTRCHITDLVGTHPAVHDALASALHDTLSILHA